MNPSAQSNLNGNHEQIIKNQSYNLSQIRFTDYQNQILNEHFNRIPLSNAHFPLGFNGSNFFNSENIKKNEANQIISKMCDSSSKSSTEQFTLTSSIGSILNQNHPSHKETDPLINQFYYNKIFIDSSGLQAKDEENKNNPLNYPNDYIESNKLQISNKRPKSTYPFGKCKVCNDKATGVHYGIATCEGCKGFFKRSTLRKEKYRCFFGNNCPLTPDNRNRCKSCRFRKCLEVGMSIQGVKMGRIPKAEKEKALMSLAKKKNEKMKNVNTPDLDINTNQEQDLSFDSESQLSSYSEDQSKKDSSQSLNEEYLSIEDNSLEENNFNKNKFQTKEISDQNAQKNDKSYCIYHGDRSNNIQNEGLLDINKNSLEPTIRIENKVKSSELSANLSKNLIISNDFSNKSNGKEKVNYSNSSQDSNDSSISQFDSVESKFENEKLNNEQITLYKRNSETQFINTKQKNREIFTVFELLRMHQSFKSSNLIVNRFHSTFHTKNSPFLDDSYLILTSLLIDKVYQVCLEHHEEVNNLFEKAIKMVKNGENEFRGKDASKFDVWDGLLISIPSCVKNLIAFCKDIPGLNELNPKDLSLIVNNHLFNYFLIKNLPLFINGESYMMLPNGIQYTRDWMIKIIGHEMVDAIFSFEDELNSLKLTPREIAIMHPFIFTTPDDDFQEPSDVASLNEYFYRAIMYEFDLNRRSVLFVNKWKKIISKLPELNALQAVKIGGLTPKSKRK